MITKATRSAGGGVMRSGMDMVAVLLVLSMAGAAMTGCGSRSVDQAGFQAAARVAVVSVVMSPVADAAREENRSVMQAAVNRASEQARNGLAGIRSWSVIDPVKEQKGKAVRSFGIVANGDLAGLFPDGEARKRAQGSVHAQLSAWKGELIGSEGLAVVPRSAFAPAEEGQETDPVVRTVMLQQAGTLCGALQVDAVAFVQVRARINHPRAAAFIVTDSRTDGMLTMAQTLVIIDRSGRVIVDMGWPPLDKIARSRDLLPLYRGAGRDAVRDENIDLGDPKKKIPAAFTALVDETAADLMTALRKAVAQ